MRLTASSIRFHILAHPEPGEPVTVSFQNEPTTCRFSLIANDLPAQNCTVTRKTVTTSADGAVDASFSLTFHHPGRYRLALHTPSTGWTNIGNYQVDATTNALPLTLLGVTPTQAVLSFIPPSESATCQIKVTATKTAASTWDFSNLVPDIDPSIFAGADTPVTYPQADGTRAIVIGKRAAEYSQYTFRMHSRALQAATAHQAWLTCGDASSTLDFTTANIMPGITYQDPLPVDPDRPGDYAYPTISWTSRTDSVIDPQTGVQIRPLSFPSDTYLNPHLGDWPGTFGSPQPSYPSRNFPAKSAFLPASVPKSLPSYYGFSVGSRLGWLADDGMLTSLLPGTLQVNCPLCSNTLITACLTADGITCAVDRSIALDPNLPPDPNTGQTGALAVNFKCTGTCSFAFPGERWKDATPVLASWHPNYTPGAPNVVSPNFQFDSVKSRSTPVSCDGSAVVNRGLDDGGRLVGAPFSVTWTKGTPVFIDNSRYTIAQVFDENAVLLNEACPASASTLLADTFGLLISSPVAFNTVTAAPYRFKVQQGLTAWDAGGDLENLHQLLPPTGRHQRQKRLALRRRRQHLLGRRRRQQLASDGHRRYLPAPRYRQRVLLPGGLR